MIHGCSQSVAVPATAGKKVTGSTSRLKTSREKDSPATSDLKKMNEINLGEIYEIPSVYNLFGTAGSVLRWLYIRSAKTAIQP